MKDFLLNSFGVLALDLEAMKRAAYMEGARYYVLFTLGLASFGYTLGLRLFPRTDGMVVYRPDLLSLFGSFIEFFLVLLIPLVLFAHLSRYLGSKLLSKAFFNLMGLSSIVFFFVFIEGLFYFATLYYLVIMGKALLHFGKLKLPQVLLFCVGCYMTFTFLYLLLPV